LKHSYFEFSDKVVQQRSSGEVDRWLHREFP